MSEFSRYRVVKTKRKRIEIVELRPWVPGDDLAGVDLKGAEPSSGDMIARNPNHYPQQWLVTASAFAVDFEPA